ncbi:MAG: two component signal transduction system envelope stress response regulator BaeR [Idiomarinaceae bacterium HL-53]|nr:MAG: two component signal transduction system envelope stress response regulator BaeR [Idiomarinaceae bacterium HL-53]CUS47683.1 two-component system, OmpR family, response regulator BaeR [Idiomarinaceae bacterium HL-53]
MTTIWIVDDEAEIRSILKDYLVHHGYTCQEFSTGNDMLEALAQAPHPDLILLDVMMPGHDGFETCQRLRALSQVPVLFISARNDELDKVLGLKLGADDYLVKPVSPREVVARVEAMLRRVAWGAASEAQASDTARSQFSLDEQGMELSIQGQAMELTRVEFRLVALLMKQPGRVFPREALVEAAYDDYRVVSDRTIDSHIKNIRAKIQRVAVTLDPIQSIYGVGYKWQEK